MNEGSIKRWAISVALGTTISIAIFFWIPILTQKVAVQELSEQSNPVFLTDFHLSQEGRPASKQRLVKPEDPPQKLPSPSLSEPRLSAAHPNIDFRSPEIDLDINPKLTTEIKIAPPKPAKAQVRPKRAKEVTPRVSDIPSGGTSPVVTNTGGFKPGSAGKAEYQLGEVDQAPKITSKAEPLYPYSARRRKISGKVIVKFLVDSKGKVQKLRILKAIPEGVFEECVITAVRNWRFKPGYLKGKAVSTWVVLPVHFRLTS